MRGFLMTLLGAVALASVALAPVPASAGHHWHGGHWLAMSIGTVGTAIGAARAGAGAAGAGVGDPGSMSVHAMAAVGPPVMAGFRAAGGISLIM